jgi:hypothetical protein
MQLTLVYREYTSPVSAMFSGGCGYYKYAFVGSFDFYGVQATIYTQLTV